MRNNLQAAITFSRLRWEVRMLLVDYSNGRKSGSLVLDAPFKDAILQELASLKNLFGLKVALVLQSEGKEYDEIYIISRYNYIVKSVIPDPPAAPSRVAQKGSY